MNITAKDMERAIARERLKAMNEVDRRIKSEQIVHNIISTGILDSYNDILLYRAMPSEVNVDKLIDYLLERGKNVYLPRVVGVELEIVKLPCEYNIGVFGICEPMGTSYIGQIDAVVVPVLAVDDNKHRLGKGKGYYDRFLVDRDCYKVAVAFSEQVLEKVTTDTNDITMDKIIVR